MAKDLSSPEEWGVKYRHKCTAISPSGTFWIWVPQGLTESGERPLGARRVVGR